MLAPSTVAAAVGAPKSVANFQSHIESWHKSYAAEPIELTFDTASGSVKRNRLTMELPSRICEDWAGLMWGEDSTVTGSVVIEDVMGEKFFPRLMDHVEGCMAMGTGALEVIADMDVTDDGTITAVRSLFIDTCDAANIYPIRWSRGEISSVAFVSYEDDGKHFTARIHAHDGERGTVTNRRFRSQGMGCSEVEIEPGVAPQFAYEGPPMFAVWSPAIRNALWPKGPYGLSVLHRPRDTFELLDSAFDNLHADIALGRKMVFMPDSMLLKDEQGNVIPPQRDRTQLFVSVRDAGMDGSKPTEFNPSLRVAENTMAVETALSLIGEMVGMGADRYRYRDGSVSTATQIISEASVTYRNRSKHLKELVSALLRIAASVDWFGQQYMGVVPLEVAVNVDDSIITDDVSREQEGRAKFMAGLLSMFRYLTEYEGLSEADANAEIARLESSGVTV